MLTLGAGAFAPLLNLPEALLRETGLFLIAYAALVGWLGTRPSVPKPLVMIVIAGNAAWTLASIALLFSGAVAPNLLGEIVVVAQAIATGVLAELQYIGLRKSGGDGGGVNPNRHCKRKRSNPSRSQRKNGLLRRIASRNDGKVLSSSAKAAIIPTSVRTSPTTSIGTRLLPANGFAAPTKYLSLTVFARARALMFHWTAPASIAPKSFAERRA